MNIVLLGEFSSLFSNLKEGLEHYGHNVITISSGDSFKEIKPDIELNYAKEKNVLKKAIGKVWQYYKFIYKLQGYDVIQIINPGFFNFRFNMIEKLFVKKLIKNNKKIFLTCAGDDYFYTQYGDNYRYFPYSELKPNERPYSGKKDKYRARYIASRVNGIIPNLYEYSQPYSQFLNLKEVVPMPVNIDKIKYLDNNFTKKVVIFHGLNREVFKGTQYIKEAMELIKINYPNEVEIIIDGKMSLDKYLNVMDTAHIIIDQCKSYGYGMNALYSLAKGKVVFSGAEKETLNEFGIEESPIININPNIEDIYKKLEYFVLNKSEIKRYSKWGREYIEQLHDYKKVAKKYIEIWGKA